MVIDDVGDEEAVVSMVEVMMVAELPVMVVWDMRVILSIVDRVDGKCG